MHSLVPFMVLLSSVKLELEHVLAWSMLIVAIITTGFVIVA
jgi:hypothetical protein